MAPSTVRNRKLRLTDNDLPTANRQPSPPCSPEVQETAIVFQEPGHPKQSLIDGEVWPPIFKPEFVRSAKAIKPRDGDVFVCTYPKCGTTWIQHICSQLMNDTYGPNVGHELCVTSPMIERMGAKFADNLPSPRLLKTHFSWNNLPKSNKAKYIFAVRNPKDCLTSYFFHNRNFKIYDFEFGDFSTFFDMFLTKSIAFGNYFDHLLSWLPHTEDENVLFLKYEDMFADLRSAVNKIGHFLGGNAAKKVDNKETLDKIVEESSLASMKKDQWRWFPENNLRQNTFIRKGGSGDWRNYFTREQSKLIDNEWRKRVTGTVAENWWIEEMAWEDEEDLGIEDGCGSESSTDAVEQNSHGAIEHETLCGSSSSSSHSSLSSLVLQRYLRSMNFPQRSRPISESSQSSGFVSLSSSPSSSNFIF